MTDALKIQHGGGHYKGLAIQPVEFSMANEFDACIHSAMKYVTRHAAKGGGEDLLKAGHFLDLRVATAECRNITAEDFISANNLPKREAEIIRLLYVMGTRRHVQKHTGKVLHDRVKQQITELRNSVYPERS